MPETPSLPENVVVLTRPVGQAEGLLHRLSGLGYDVLELPLLEITPPPDMKALQQCFDTLERYRLVLFVSPNAVAGASQCFPEVWPHDVMVGVVGPGSLATLAGHGVTDAVATVWCPDDSHDSEGLLSLLPLDQLQGQRVLIVRAQDGRPLLGTALQEAGMQVDYVAAYGRHGLVPDDRQQALFHVLPETQAVWVVTSSEALRHLLGLVKKYAGSQGVVKLQRQRMVVTHDRIAEVAASLGFSKVFPSGTGDEDVIAKLQSFL